MDNRVLFSKLPKVDQLLASKEIENILENQPREIVVETIRQEIDTIRASISKGDITSEELIRNIEELPRKIEAKVLSKTRIRLKKVINGTGVVIHTNLGRSLLSKEVAAHITEIASNYSNLEFDLEKGTRGSRYSHLEDIITRITGAESALVVNNNAAAVMIVLSALAKDKEVIVSRGELVEIGGSFRVPAVMEQSGAKLVDVGTTNKTHHWDYEMAISENTGALLKVHTSNYRIVGFTANVPLEELVSLGNRHSIPLIEDLGSGVLIDLSKYGLEYEPTVQESVKAGVDIVTFSGDKLLGGPQAGIIVGKKKYIDIMKKHPLNRAFRIDKFTVSALEATLRLYLNEDDAIKQIPTLNMLTKPIEELEEKASKLLATIMDEVQNRLPIEIVDQFSQVGGGSMPLEEIPTKALMVDGKNINIASLERDLRGYDTPIITRVYKDKMYLDLRTINNEDFELIAKGFKHALDNR